jgi:hypothetical protein
LEYSLKEPEPLHDSSLSGDEYCREILGGNPAKILEVCRMPKATFLHLHESLLHKGLAEGTSILRESIADKLWNQYQDELIMRR